MFTELEKILLPLVQNINLYLSNYILVIMLVGVGLWFTVRTKFVQVRCFADGLKLLFGNFSLSGKKHHGGMSSFQALTAAVASQVGTGNIVGAAGAVLIGGPGAIFWMWVIAFLGMATIYAEAVLAVHTRVTEPDGHIKGGPVYYITTAFKGRFGKFLSHFFAIAIILALGCMGTMVQSNSISSCIQTAFGIPHQVTGIILAGICCAVFMGGVRRLAAVTEKIVPFMAVLFIIGGLIILLHRISYIPYTFKMILNCAFHPQAILGGGFWYALMTAVSQGTKRGLFSNEAGMGSTPHAHALAHVKNPHEQGVFAMMGVFIDTFIILTMVALIIISTLYTPEAPLANGYTGAVTEIFNKTNLVQSAFGSIFGNTAGSAFVAVCLLFFAFTSILSWNLFGKINALYLFGNKNPKRAAVVYTVVTVGFIMVGTLISNDFVWELTDMFNNLMVLPNVIALFALTGTVVLISENKNTDV